MSNPPIYYLVDLKSITMVSEPIWYVDRFGIERKRRFGHESKKQRHKKNHIDHRSKDKRKEEI